MGDNKGRFPGPYINSTNADDPIMKRVPMNHLEIGARPSGMPKSMDDTAKIVHVGETATGKGR